MIISTRLWEIRAQKKLSQHEIEKRSGLLRRYVSRIEDGHTVPTVETLKKLSRALKTPLYQLLYDGDGIPQAPTDIGAGNSADKAESGSIGIDAQLMRRLRMLLAPMSPQDRVHYALV